MKLPDGQEPYTGARIPLKKMPGIPAGDDTEGIAGSKNPVPVKRACGKKKR